MSFFSRNAKSGGHSPYSLRRLFRSGESDDLERRTDNDYEPQITPFVMSIEASRNAESQRLPVPEEPPNPYETQITPPVKPLDKSRVVASLGPLTADSRLFRFEDDQFLHKLEILRGLPSMQMKPGRIDFRLRKSNILEESMAKVMRFSGEGMH